MQPRKQFLIVLSVFLLGFGVLVYAGTLSVNNIYGFTNAYGFTWVNSTNVDFTNYYLNSVAINARLGGDYSGLPLTGTSLDTGFGAHELYAMNQDVQTTDDVTFDNVTASDSITLGGVTRNTWPAGGGHVHDQTLNTTDDVTFDNITASDSITLGGVKRGTWPAGGGGAGSFYFAENFIVFTNSSGYYSQNGTDGSIYTSGPVFDPVLNNTVDQLKVAGGKVVITPGNYTYSTNATIKVPSYTEIEILGGVTIFLEAPCANGTILFENMNASNSYIWMHGNGVIDGNRANQDTSTLQTCVQFNQVDHGKVDIYIHHFRGWNFRDLRAASDTDNVYVNRFYPDAGKKIDRMLPDMLSFSDSRVILNCSWDIDTAFGWVNYTGDYTEANYSMKGIPQGAGAERLRLAKTYNVPIDVDDCNIGFWMKTQGELPTGNVLSVYLELWDNVNVVKQFRWSWVGDELNNSNKEWFHLMFYNSSYVIDNGCDLTNIDDLRIRFLADNNNWNVTIDEVTAYPCYTNHPNGAVVFSWDGPYARQFNMVYPLLAEHGYKGCISTSYDIPGEDPGNGDAFLDELKQIYSQGWDVCVYVRMFDVAVPPRPLSEAEILDFALMQKQWLIDNGFTRSAGFLHCNRHLLDVTTYQLLEDYFYIMKGSYPGAVSDPNLPTNVFYGVSTIPANDQTAVNNTHINGGIYNFFNHFNAEAYTKAQFQTLVDLIAGYNMDVLTWSDIKKELLEGNK